MTTAKDRLRRHLANIELHENAVHIAKNSACKDAAEVMNEFTTKLINTIGAEEVEYSTYDMAHESRKFDLLLHFDSSEHPLEYYSINCLRKPDPEIDEGYRHLVVKDGKPIFTDEEIDLVFDAAEILHDKMEESSW